jgi:uncharacterized protein YgiM (DUF1202 family)
MQRKQFYLFQSGTIKITVVIYFCKDKYPMKKSLMLLYLLLIAFAASAQDLTVFPNGVLDGGDAAQVTGDYVRIRSGPTLEYRILDKVNTGTVVSVLERSRTTQKIGDMENYWYRVKVNQTGVEGWMYGAFLKNNETEASSEPPPVPLPQQAGTAPADPTPSVLLKEIGNIVQKDSYAASGDLDQNGVPEILLLHRDERGRYFTVTGYEFSGGSFNEIYNTELRNTSVRDLSVYRHPGFTQPIVVVSGENTTYLYGFDAERRMLRVLTTLNSPAAAFGELDGTNPSIVYLKKNKVADNDGTVTYYIRAEKITYSRGRLRLGDRIEYEKPLPVKKLLLFDLDGDRSAEIVTEIGGNQSGGGISVLKYTDKGLDRVINTGIPTYNSDPFIRMWGVEAGGRPALTIYSTDPAHAAEVNSELGLLSASMHGGTLSVDGFKPLNRRLDETNNGRQVIYYRNGQNGWDGGFPFLILDYSPDASRFIVKRMVFDP